MAHIVGHIVIALIVMAHIVMAHKDESASLEEFRHEPVHMSQHMPQHMSEPTLYGQRYIVKGMFRVAWP